MSRIGYTFEIVFFCLAAVLQAWKYCKKPYRKKNRTVSFIIFLSAENLEPNLQGNLFGLKGLSKFHLQRIHPFGKPSLISIGAGRGDFFYHGKLKIGGDSKVIYLKTPFFGEKQRCVICM